MEILLFTETDENSEFMNVRKWQWWQIINDAKPTIAAVAIFQTETWLQHGKYNWTANGTGHCLNYINWIAL